MKIRILAAIAVAMAMLGAQGAAAYAGPGHDHTKSHAASRGDAIRYASAKGCPRKDGNVVPCGTWRLVSHKGEVTLLKDAQVRALGTDGKPVDYAVAPMAVSGDGTKVAYYTKAGRLVVRTMKGGVKPLAADALPARTNQYDVTLQLSDDGARLAVIADRVRLFDTATGGRLGTLPKHSAFVGFSGDGQKVLVSTEGEESEVGLHVHDLSGGRLLSDTPPQLVAANGPYALHADGRTLAVLVGDKKVMLYDLSTGQVAGQHKIKLPKDGTVHKIDWTGGNQVTLHVSQYGKATRMTVLQHDVTSGATRVRDAYTILKDTFVFAACGG
ncbi:WD40 repeat domain-containing protein [Nonomuraea sp. NPDC059194]|uniref:WD40 repeat domain-containing protein n=1 Tax=Nonomuraea sp. NPDC059194 TaxID=3346764 RepID=UPI0036C4C086